jgi:mono/diheme cytochrome c family protein
MSGMKILILAYIAAAIIGVAFWKHAPKYVEAVAPSGVDAKLWHRGMVMYKARCTTCHNSNPDLPGSVGPVLRGVSEELIRDRLTNGKGGMPAQKNMLHFVSAFREYLK